jgi:fatty-acyl-CoA synthase
MDSLLAERRVSTSTYTELPPTLYEALIRARGTERLGFTFLTPTLEARDWTWSDLARASWMLAQRLHGQGVTDNDRVALPVLDEQEFVLGFFACIWLHAVPIPLCPPSDFAALEPQLDHLGRILEASRARWVLAPAAVLGKLECRRDRFPHVRGWLSIEQARSASAAMPNWTARGDAKTQSQDLCLLQFTSGSTGNAKGVMVSHGNLVSNVRSLHRRLQSDHTRDIGISWAPLYHDMGLVGSVVTPLLSLGRHVFIPTSVFATRPQTWLEVAHHYRGTMLSTNNFGLRAATRRLPRVPNLDLSCVRVISIGAEPIQAATLERFATTFARFGLSPACLNPAYGMAETTLAVSAGAPDAVPRVVHIDAAAYDQGRVERVKGSVAAAGGTAIVSCGSPLDDHEVALVDGAGVPLGPGRVGEIAVRGPSVTLGYFNEPPTKAARTDEGFFRTGDLGFFDQGELFVAGRIKELVIVAGKNHHPQLIENAAIVEGIRPGHVCAFSVPGEDTEQLIVVAECENPHRAQTLLQAVRRAVLGQTGLAPREVVIVQPWSLPKTSSGKLQRGQVKRLYLESALQRVPSPERAPSP